MQTDQKLVIAQANFHNLWGGQAEVVLALSHALAERGHRVHVISPPGSELAARAHNAGLSVFTGCHFPKRSPLGRLRDAWRLRAFLREKGVQIYHCHGSQDHWTGALGAPPQTRIVRTRHNIYPVQNHFMNRWLFRKRSAQVILIFSGQAHFFTGSGLLRSGQLVTLHSPLPQNFASSGPVPRVLRGELNLPPGALLTGFAASFHPDKAPLDFVAVAKRAAAELPHVFFAMAGHGPLLEPVREEIRKSGLEGRVHLLGFRRDIREVMASFDVFMLTSVTREASSTVAKQAGAAGIPVIATDVGGTREIIEDGRTGVLVQPGDIEGMTRALRSLAADRENAAKMGRCGQQKVLGEFTAEAIAARTEAVYREVLGRSAAQA